MHLSGDALSWTPLTSLKVLLSLNITFFQSSEVQSVIHVATDLKVSRQAIYRVQDAVTTVAPGMTAPWKPGSGAPRKTSARTDKLLKHEVMNNSCITQEKTPKHPPDDSTPATKRSWLPARRTAKKPLLTNAMKKRRLQFCKKYKDWTSEFWKR
ncbi:hypothetical protein E2C01_041617 [Portunus trituberculatus]|uniref:Transposase Tc1-like domain-containing protein n=1 Tax=Portunus trituberculatus TaxID=210409 RepID=A0A5B7FSC9_PORTR|nr:hypothetical protein [Portunus trituberculatus]